MLIVTTVARCRPIPLAFGTGCEDCYPVLSVGCSRSRLQDLLVPMTEARTVQAYYLKRFPKPRGPAQNYADRKVFAGSSREAW